MQLNRVLLSAIAMLAFLFLLGHALAQEKKLKKSDLPPAVQKTVDERSKGAIVRGYASEMDHGKLQYELELTVDGRSKDVTISPDGKVVEVEEELALEGLPAGVRKGLQEKAGTGKIIKVESITKRGTLVAYEAQVRTGNKLSGIQVGPDGGALAHKE